MYAVMRDRANHVEVNKYFCSISGSKRFSATGVRFHADGTRHDHDWLVYPSYNGHNRNQLR